MVRCLLSVAVLLKALPCFKLVTAVSQRPGLPELTIVCMSLYVTLLFCRERARWFHDVCLKARK